MSLEHTGCELRHGMVAEVGREIADTNAIMCVYLAAPDRRERSEVGNAALGSLQLILGRGGDGEKLKRSRWRLKCSGGSDDGRDLRIQVGPIA